MRIERLLLFLLSSFLLCAINAAGQQASAPDWADWKFLMGEWTGQGSGHPGEGRGGFTLKPDLQQHVLVRTNYAEYPASKDRSAFRHDDLMVIYRENTASPAQAIYFDSEGHVIHYAVSVDPAAKSAIFLSQSENGSPRYRLTYSAKSPDSLTIKFEIAPGDKPEQFHTYIEATAKRTAK